MFNVSIIVSNFNGEKYLPKLIETLNNQQGVQLEMIVVDRHSTDSSLQILSQHPNIKVIQEPPENGLVAGYHAGYKVASYDLLFFCNEDMWFDEQCMYNCAKWIDIEKKIAASDPWQWTYDGKDLAHAGVRFVKKRNAYNFSQPIPFIEEDTLVLLNEGDFVPIASAGAAMIHREAYEETGGWDTSFFLDAEEQDLYIRFWKLGWNAVTVPTAKVYHAISVASDKIVKKVTVKQKRYISNFSNKSIIAIKYLPLSIIVANLFARLCIIAMNIFKLRLKMVRFQLMSLMLTAKRLPAAIGVRKKFTAEKYPTSLDFYYKDFYQQIS